MNFKKKKVKYDNFKGFPEYIQSFKERINKHNNNKGAKSTKGHKWELIYKKKIYIKIKSYVL